MLPGSSKGHNSTFNQRPSFARNAKQSTDHDPACESQGPHGIQLFENIIRKSYPTAGADLCYNGLRKIDTLYGVSLYLWHFLP